jgi:hypothetical protein
MKGYIPDLVDHFPSLRRGHGRGLGRRVPPRMGPQRYQRCAVAGCGLLGRQTAHHDREANIADWQEEHGVKLDSLTTSQKPLRRAA